MIIEICVYIQASSPLELTTNLTTIGPLEIALTTGLLLQRVENAIGNIVVCYHLIIASDFTLNVLLSQS